MPADSERRGRKSTYLNGKDTPPQAGDEMVGGWSHAELERMDQRFTERMRSAIERRDCNG
jgi:hypothetical protein